MALSRFWKSDIRLRAHHISGYSVGRAGLAVLLIVAAAWMIASPSSATDDFTVDMPRPVYHIHTESGVGVFVREHPGTEYRQVGWLADGDPVRIYCVAWDDQGRLWDHIGVDMNVLDEHVQAGTSKPAAPVCGQSTRREPISEPNIPEQPTPSTPEPEPTPGASPRPDYTPPAPEPEVNSPPTPEPTHSLLPQPEPAPLPDISLPDLSYPTTSCLFGYHMVPLSEVPPSVILSGKCPQRAPVHMNAIPLSAWRLAAQVEGSELCAKVWMTSSETKPAQSPLGWFFRLEILANCNVKALEWVYYVY